MLVLVVFAIKVGEDAIGGDSGEIDKAMLLLIHKHAPAPMVALFDVVTETGSSKVLFPLTTLGAAALLVARRRRDALLLGGSVASAAALVYLVKTLVGRARPALWESEWFWGSSFPSGHTLVTAAFSTSAALCISRIWPAAGPASFAIAILWIVLVAASRLVLGVHWPTDVLAAACIGAFLPLAFSFALDMRYPPT